MEFFGTLSKEWAPECMKDLLLVNLRKSSDNCAGSFLLLCFVIPLLELFYWRLLTNLLLQVAKEYSEQLGVDACIKLFEQFNFLSLMKVFISS